MNPTELRPSLSIEWGDVQISLDIPPPPFIVEYSRVDAGTVRVSVQQDSEAARAIREARDAA